MGDDRPYIHDGLLELPVHWSLDDWPHLHWKPGHGDAFTAPEAFLDTWLAEFDSAHRDRPARHVHDAPRGDRPRIPRSTCSIDSSTRSGIAPTCGSPATAMWQPVLG